jgi:uncharacterized protein (DUF1800 family)
MEIVLPTSQWTFYAAAHLLNRAGFGGTPEEINKLYAMGHEKAVAFLLNPGEETDLFPPPELTTPSLYYDRQQAMKELPEEERQAFKKLYQRDEGDEISAVRQWWLNRMRYSTFAAREKAVLFWHGHWASSIDKVRWPFQMWQQNETLRAYAFGSIPAFAKEISRDPAMIKYLDLNSSSASKPNENFARELMELFLLGEGNYSESDIQQSARAFTGYRIDQKTGAFRFDKKQNNTDTKVFFGRTGKFSGDEIIDIITSQPRCAEYLAEKIWIFYAGTPPSPTTLSYLVQTFRQSGLNTGHLMKSIFLNQDFYAPSVVRHQIKSPIQWFIQTCKTLDIPLPKAPHTENMLRQLGQQLLAPPNVKGWDGGRAWISSSSLLLRYNMAGQLVKARSNKENSPITAPNIDLIIPPNTTPEIALESLGKRLFQSPLPPNLKEKSLAFLEMNGNSAESRRDLLHLAMSTPEFQLT